MPKKQVNRIIIMDRCLGSKVRFQGCGHKSHSQARINFRGMIVDLSLPMNDSCLACRMAEIMKVKKCNSCDGPLLRDFGLKHACPNANTRQGPARPKKAKPATIAAAPKPVNDNDPLTINDIRSAARHFGYGT